MIPMVLGSMGMKRIVVQVVNRFGYRRVLVATTLGLSLVTLFVYDYRSVGLALRFAVRPVFTRNGQLNAFLLHEHPDAERSPGQSGEQRKQPAVDDYAIVDVSASLSPGCCWDFLVHSMSASTAAPHKPSLCTPGLAWR